MVELALEKNNVSSGYLSLDIEYLDIRNLSKLFNRSWEPLYLIDDVL